MLFIFCYTTDSPFLYRYVFALHSSEYPRHPSHPASEYSLNILLLDQFLNNVAIPSSLLARKMQRVFTISLSPIFIYSDPLLHYSDHSLSSHTLFIELRHCYIPWCSLRRPQCRFMTRIQIFCQIFPVIHLQFTVFTFECIKEASHSQETVN
jgi:hypothetical protein